MVKRSKIASPKAKRPLAEKPTIPDFKSEREAAEFWDTHDSTDYLHELKPVNIKVELKKHISIRLAPRQVKEAKLIAAKKNVGYQTLMRMWIQEGINKEKKHVA